VATDGFQRLATAISVSDLDRSTRFYCEGLGFKEGPSSGMQTAEAGGEIAKMMALPSAKFQSRFLQRPDGGLEMIQFYQPSPIGKGEPTPNNVGLRGLLFNCPDAAAAAARLVELGGTLIYGGKDGGTGTYPSYFVFDPDGVRIQLVSIPSEMASAMAG
jgi:catechol 2,3-dioxygenase-like lactoylglutathione lyase family enzyme